MNSQYDDDDNDMGPAIGIRNAMLMGIVIWVVIVFIACFIMN